jgi:GNAT superfamily N-acetyltransferase
VSPVRLLAASFIPAAAAMWRAEQLEVYQEPEWLPAPDETLDLFRDIVYEACESWWVLPQDQSIGGILGLKHEHIAHLYVGAEFRRQGFGTALVAHAKTIYPRRLTAFTTARISGFYLNLGFCLDEATSDEVRLTWQPDLGRPAPRVR